MPAQAAPASVASTIAMAMWAGPARSAHDEPTQTETIAPMVHWPWPPMLNRPQRKANATARPVKISVVVRRSVCCRLKAAAVALAAGHPGEEPVEAGPVEDALVRRQRVVAGRQHHHSADQEGQDRRDDRRDDAAALRREPAAHAAGLPVGSRIRRVGRWRGWGGGAHGASGRAPSIAPPRASRLGAGGELRDDAPLVDHEDAVRERQDLLELERHQQDRAALVALGDEPPVHVLDRADVEPAGRLGRHQHGRVARHLAGDDDLLLVAARQRRPPGSWRRRRARRTRSAAGRRPRTRCAAGRSSRGAPRGACRSRAARCSRPG